MCFECYNKEHPKSRRALCHKGRIAWAKGMCKSCYDRHLRLSNPDYDKRQKSITNDWIAKNKEYLVNKHSEYYKRPEIKERNYLNNRVRTLSAFGLSLDDESRILSDQNYGCKICGGPAGRKGVFDIDHDHKTGEFRGFICHRCNKGLGLLGDDIESLEKALAYLRGS
jgi:hypothetical protein